MGIIGTHALIYTPEPDATRSHRIMATASW